MVPGITLLVLGGILLVSGWTKRPLTAVFDGTPAASDTPVVPGYGVPGSNLAGPVSPATGNALDVLQTAMGKSVHGSGVRMMDGHPVAAWIVPILKWARDRGGWKGQVTSGYRTYAQQEAAASNYGLSHYGPGGPQASNHRKTAYPGGAVDVTNPEQLNSVLQHYPGSPTLVWGGPVMGDTVHFSANGH